MYAWGIHCCGSRVHKDAGESEVHDVFLVGSNDAELVQSVFGQFGVFAEKPTRQFLVEVLWQGAGNN